MSRLHLIRAERGMTVVEVMVAAMILVIGSLALLSLVDAGARNTFRAEQSQVVSNRLQSELESIRELDYEQVALTGVPIPSSDPKLPSWRASGTSFAIDEARSDFRPLVYEGGSLEAGGAVTGAAVSAAPEPFTSGDVSGSIYRYVVWENDPTCPAAYCPGTQDVKRVIVAVTLNASASGGARAYQELQGEIVDPEVIPEDNANPIDPSEETSKPWTFFLTDTTCNNTARQPIVGEHLTHNTRGRCATGLTNSNSPGASDLLYPELPPFDPEQPTFDYATDVEPLTNPLSDRGLQLIELEASGCPSWPMGVVPTAPDPGDPHRFKRVHKWVTPAMPAGTSVDLDGVATFNIWSQSVDAATYPGKICVWLFVRKTNLLGVAADTAATNLAAGAVGEPYFTYSENEWPTSWTEIVVPLSFDLDTTLLEGDRLGLALGVDRDSTGVGTTETGLQFHYDEPSFDSRLEVKTHSDLPVLNP